MRVLIFGSRSLTWKHHDVMRTIARYAILDEDLALGTFIERWTKPGNLLTEAEKWHEWKWLPTDSGLVLLNGDGPPSSSTRGAVGADKLAFFACMQSWWEYKSKRVRWFPPEVAGERPGMSWGQAAAKRNRDMVGAKPDRAYCVHTCLEQSKGSSMTARLLTEAGSPYWYVRVAQSGELIDVAEMRP